MIIFFYLTIIFFLLGQLGRISFLNQKINFYLYEILIFIQLLFFIIKFKLKPFFHQKINLFYWLFFYLLFFFLLGSLQFNLKENLIAFLYLLRLIFYFLYGIFFYYILKNKFINKIYLLKAINFLTILILIISFSQYLFYPDLRNLYYLGWDDHLYRMFGLFFDTSIAAAVYGLLFLFHFLDSKNKKIIRISFCLLLLTSLVLTFSRANLISFFLIIYFYFLKKREIKKIFLVSFFILFILLIAPKPFGEGVNLLRSFSIKARINDYKTAINIWHKNRWFGIGYNRIGLYKDFSDRIDHARFSFSSSFLIMLVTGGVVGFFLFFLTIVNLFKNLKNGKLIFSFILVASIFDNILLHPFIIFLLIILISYINLLPFDKKQ